MTEPKFDINREPPVADTSSIEFESYLSTIEEKAGIVYNYKYIGAPKPPPKEIFVASFMAELSRRLHMRAVVIEKEYNDKSAGL